jgi:dTDP-4-amino-4,6-dideoxygalactose transaminase
MRQQPFLPFHRPSIGEEEIGEVVATLRSGWITTGPRTALFEKDFSAYVRSPLSLAVNSCTAGLHLALAALDIGPGDEVITTPLTFCATVNTIIHVGATPVLADIGDDGNIDPASIRERVTSKTKALLPVHFAGLPCDMNTIWSIAREQHLFVIEDAAHAVGSQYRGVPIGAGDVSAGAASDAVAFSFYATKNLTTGEGGMITTHSESTMDRMRRLCLHGISKDAWSRYTETGNWFYAVTDCGFKYNLSDIQAAIGIHQLRKQEGFVKIRTQYARYYNERFAAYEELQVPPTSANSRHSWHLYVLRLNLNRLRIARSEFIEQLRNRGIGTSVHFIPIPTHPYFEAKHLPGGSECPNTVALYPRLVSLPLYPAMTWEDVKRVADAVIDLIQQSRRVLAVAG